MNSFSTLPTVILGGIANSLYPCGIAVLLIFISVMFMLRKERKVILQIGAAYILSVYVTYFLIGIGLLKAVNFLGIPTMIPKIMAVIIIIFGLLNIKEYLFPNLPLKIRMPLSARHFFSEWAYKASVPAAIVMGIVVAFVGLPCSGGIYITIIGLLSVKTTFMGGISYLLIYDFFFVFPMILIFILATNRAVTEKFINYQEQHGKKLHLALAAMMIIMGIILLVR